MTNKEELQKQKNEIEKELARIRQKRYLGIDDDIAEDITEELYRELLIIEKEINTL